MLNKIKTPKDLAVEVNRKRKEISVHELPTDFPIFDIGTETVEEYAKIIMVRSQLSSVDQWAFLKTVNLSSERKKFLKKSRIRKPSPLPAVATQQQHYIIKLADKISFVSTAGGALTEYLMGKQLPGVTALEKAAARET